MSLLCRQSKLIINCKHMNKLVKINKKTLFTSNLKQSCSCLYVNCCNNNSSYILQVPSLSSRQLRSFFCNQGLWSGKLVPFHLSDIGEGISEVVLKEWFIKIGDEVAQFDPICEVQSDKASVTITSRYDGIVEKIYYDVDEVAKVGKPLVDIRLKDDGKEGLVQPDPVDQVADLEASQICESSPTGLIDWKGVKVLTTPAVRRIAAENNVTLSDVRGTGKDGRILKEDVMRFIEDSKAGRAQPLVSDTTVKVNDQRPAFSTPPAARQTESPKSTTVLSSTSQSSQKLQDDRTVPFTAMQRGMFKSMTQSLKIPHFGLSDEVELSNLIQIMPRLKEQAAQKGLKMTYMPLFIKALSIALSDYPIINSSLDEKNEKIILKASHNVGFAMDTKDGLVVPNVKNVQNLSVLEIAEEMKRLQEAGARGQLRKDDLSGGTITLSNIGSIGGLFGIPVIPPSEVVIGAIGQMKIVPRFDEKGDIVKGHIINILWSADHRIIDGATMCRFSALWKSLVQDPLRMIMELK